MNPPETYLPLLQGFDQQYWQGWLYWRLQCIECDRIRIKGLCSVCDCRNWARTKSGAKSNEAVPVLYLQNPLVQNPTKQCVLCICKIHWFKIHRSSVLQCMLCMLRSAAARSKNRFQSFSNVMPYGPISIEWATQNLIHFDLSLHHHQNPAHLTVCF